MTKRTLLVLAASTYQLPIIRRARELGWRVLTSDNVPENPGHRLADRAYGIDTTDCAGILDIAQKEAIDGLIAAGTDVALPTAAWVGEALGLTAPPVSAVAICCDKANFRRWQKEQGLPHPLAFAPDSPFLCEGQLPEAGSWLIKPDRSSGSKGVFLIGSDEELRRRLPQSRSFSPKGRAVLERFIAGRQLTCEGLLSAGKIAACWITDRRTAPPPHTATRGHRLPARLTDDERAALLASLADAWRRLGVTDGPFDADLVLAEDGLPYILEMTPRLGGNSLSTLIRASADFDLIAFALRQAMGEAPVVPELLPPKPAGLELLGVEREGRLAFDETEFARLQSEPWLLKLQLDCRLGDEVQPFINGRHRVGEALFVAEDRDALDARADELLRRLRLRAI